MAIKNYGVLGTILAGLALSGCGEENTNSQVDETTIKENMSSRVNRTIEAGFTPLCQNGVNANLYFGMRLAHGPEAYIGSINYTIREKEIKEQVIRILWDNGKTEDFLMSREKDGEITTFSSPVVSCESKD